MFRVRVHDCRVAVEIFHVLADGSIEVTASTTVTVTAPTVRVVGNLEVTGNVVATGTVTDSVGSMAAMRDVYNAHLAARHPGALEAMV